MNFNQLYSFLFEEFKKSPKHVHLYDVPMFSIYVKDDQKQFFYQTLPISNNELKDVFASARNKIIKMGFSAMHVNVLFNDLQKDINQNTGGGVGGYASRKGKYMTIDISQLENLQYLEKVIIHEWAHLWMYNNSSGFKKAVKEFYQQILNRGKEQFEFFDNRYILDILDKDEIKPIFDKHFKKMVSSIKETYELSKKSDYMNEVTSEYLQEEIQNQIRFFVEDFMEDMTRFLYSKKFFINLSAKQADIDKVVNFAMRIGRFIVNDIETDNDIDTITGKHFRMNINSFLNMFIEIIKQTGNYPQPKNLKQHIGLRESIFKLVEWVNAYGLSNDDEIWATGVEEFVKLPDKYKKEIMRLMQTQDRRDIPNRTMRKRIKS
jgi:hypothetical protein